MSDAPAPVQFTCAHLGVAVPDLNAAVDSYRKLFGYELLRGPFIDPLQRVTVCFLGKPGAVQIEMELVSPVGEDSPICGILTRGGGAYHICYRVNDLDAAIIFARDNGCLLISGPTPAVAFDGMRIAWLYLPSRQLIELLEEEPA